MATNIPPHNLGELVNVLCALIHNPEATLQELLEYMPPAPDFPTGGTIMGNLVLVFFFFFGNLEEFGNLISASGLSSIENYECGAEPLIQIYKILLKAPGVYGARFSGAGFRGCL
ncbi:unnamed protein product [Arabidopsis lyrata]|nr:unnamed protein product [Arabidopsis lyrata]